MTSDELFEIFKKNKLVFFTGVPDSTFKGWMSFLAGQNKSKFDNIVACNECEAVAIAAGYHFATEELGVVYMQNAGLGKAVNPLTSLCDPEVYSVPMIMMIGWRGKPGEKDEPQHKKMGKITLPLLDVLKIPYEFLPPEKKEAEKVIERAKKIALERKIPTALIIEKGTISEYGEDQSGELNYDLTRERAMEIILENLSEPGIIISTTGKISRELYELRVGRNEIPVDFYMVGSMGCSASVALGIALKKVNKKVLIFDGDGAILMQLGALSTIGRYNPKNLVHIIFDNESYESTGGQPTNSNAVNLDQVALNCSYEEAVVIKEEVELKKIFVDIQKKEGPIMLVIKVNKESRKNLGRPSNTPIENKINFMKYLQK